MSMCVLPTLHVLGSYAVDAPGHGSAGRMGEVKGIINGAEVLQQKGVGDGGVMWVVVEGDPIPRGGGGNQVEETVISDI